jgi:3-phosphoshikimate 1-carboxyvinyltransferase
MLGGPTFASGPLRGELTVPGDKSVSHRALIAAACARQPISISNLNPGRDVRATLEALRALDVAVEGGGAEITVTCMRLRESTAPLDCMNSGSTARMVLGACAGANIPARFDGDASLRSRPMEPVAAQLRAFGAKIDTTDGHLPMRLWGRAAIETRNFILLSPSAQVKSALLFAAAFANVAISVTGDRGSRDHTERLLRYLGADVEWDGRRVALRPGALRAEPVKIPGDFSAAAFFITAATVTPGSSIVVRRVGVNPTRTGLLDALRHMGARIGLHDRSEMSGEPVADVSVEYAPLRSSTIGADLALRAIDEVPLLAVAAAFASGETRIEGIGTLRSKESDRVAAIGRLLDVVGIAHASQSAGLSIFGGTPATQGRVVETRDDHRIAMAAAVLACAAGPIQVDSDASIDVSFPSFAATLEGSRRR